MALTKNDIATALYDKGLFLQREAAEFVELVLENIKDNLEAGEDVKISGFGKFHVRGKKTRVGRNPRTGEKHEISARSVVTWSPAEKLRDKVN